MRQRREASKTRGRRRRVLARARASSDAGHLAFSGGVAAHTLDFARSLARRSRSGTRDDGRVSTSLPWSQGTYTPPALSGSLAS